MWDKWSYAGWFCKYHFVAYKWDSGEQGFNDVTKVAIIHKKINPILAIDQIWKEKIKAILLFYGYLLEPVVEIWFFFWNLEMWRIRTIFSKKSFECGTGEYFWNRPL